MRTIIAANWKMNKTRTEAKATAHELASILGGAPDDRDVVVFAPFTALEATREGLDGAPGIFVGAQNMYPAESGAFTGEISPAMLREAGCTWVLTGHSERRHVLGESPDFVGKKTAFALEQGFSVILCIGETLAERKAGKLNSILWLQLERGLARARPQCGLFPPRRGLRTRVGHRYGPDRFRRRHPHGAHAGTRTFEQPAGFQRHRHPDFIWRKREAGQRQGHSVS